MRLFTYSVMHIEPSNLNIKCKSSLLCANSPELGIIMAARFSTIITDPMSRHQACGAGRGGQTLRPPSPTTRAPPVTLIARHKTPNQTFGNAPMVE